MDVQESNDDRITMGLTSAGVRDLEFFNLNNTLYLNGDAANGAIFMSIGSPVFDSNFKLLVQGSVGPNADAAYDLGSTSNRWQDLYTSSATVSYSDESSNGHLSILQNANGDATMSFRLTAATNGYAMGVDNSDGDKFKISYAGSGIPSLGTSDRFTIDTTGNVGIGDSSPEAKLKVNGTVLATAFNGDGSALTGITSTPSADSLDFSELKDTMSLDTTTNITMTNGDLNFDSDTLVIDSSANNIGIGNGSPAAKLDVNGGIKIGANAGSCSGTNAGEIRYNGSTATIEYCDGSSWDGLVSSSTGPWQLAFAEDFDTTPTGWSTNTTTTCNGHTMLGGYAILGGTGTTTVYKTFDLSSYTHTMVMIKFNYFSIDTWDNEFGTASINGSIAWSKKADQLDGHRIDMCGASNKDLIMSGEARLEHTASTVEIRFGSDLDEAATNEAFGVDNLEVWVK